MASRSVGLKEFSELDLQNRYRKYSSEKKDIDALGKAAKISQSSAGAYKIFKLFSKVSKYFVVFTKKFNFNPEVISKFLQLEGNFKFLSQGLVISKISVTANGLKKSVANFQKESSQEKHRKRDKVIKNIFEMISDVSFLMLFGDALSLYSLKSSIVSLTALSCVVSFSSINAKMLHEDLNDQKALEKAAKNTNSERLQTISSENKKLTMLKLAKTIATIALTVLVILKTFFKMIILSEPIVLFLSTVASILAIYNHYYSEALTYPQKK